MRVHKLRKFLASKRGEVLQTQRQAGLDLVKKGGQKPLGGALLQTLIARSDVAKGGQS